MAPTLVQSYLAVQSALNLTACVTASFTPADNEILVVKAVGADSALTWGNLPTGGSLVYTSRASVAPSSHCSATSWTAPVGTSPGSMTVSVTPAGTGNWHSILVERWSAATLAATPASVATSQAAGSAPSATVTTVGTNSVVSWAIGDWAAVSPATRAYRSSAVEESIHDGSTTQYVAYYAYQAAAAAGAQTIGMTAPTQTPTLVGIEVQAGASPAVVQPPPQFSRVPINRANLW